MFTGIIESVGQIEAMQRQGSDLRLRIATGKMRIKELKLGDSIAVSGVCLTATELPGDGFWADVSAETLDRTVLGELKTGALVNLEQALTPSSRLGGHLVSGHVDGIGRVTQWLQEGRSWRLAIAAPSELMCYIAVKGSICVDGVSLTVNSIRDTEFNLNIVPHTLQETTLSEYKIGQRVNLEVDIIARYLERLLVRDDQASMHGVSTELLRERGFL